jgi:hypothetical protein
LASKTWTPKGDAPRSPAPLREGMEAITCIFFDSAS